MDADEDFISTTEAARRLKVSRETVRRMCVNGVIGDARQIDDGRSAWQVPKKWVDDFVSGARRVIRRRG